MKILITSGGTKVKIDMVRSITNMSKGTFGSKIAKEASDRRIKVDFLHALDSKMPSENNCFDTVGEINTIPFVTFEDYSEKLFNLIDNKPDIVFLSAAVSDYGVENYIDGKIRSNEEMVIKLKPLPKLISKIKEKLPNSVLCGFKLLVNSTEEELKEAIISSIDKNRCDLVIGNDLRDIKNNNHQLLIGEKNNDKIIFNKYNSKDDYLPKIVINHCVEKYNNLFAQKEN